MKFNNCCQQVIPAEIYTYEYAEQPTWSARSSESQAKEQLEPFNAGFGKTRAKIYTIFFCTLFSHT